MIAVVISVPVSLGIALFTTQVAPSWLKKWLVSLTDLVAVVPSVVFGLWGIIFLAPKLVGFYKTISGWFDGWPVLGDIFGKASAGRTFMTAGLILSVMITPIITSIAREVIETTPADRPRRRAGAGRDAVGDDHRRRAAALDERHRRRRHAGARPGDGRDHRCRTGDRLVADDHRQPLLVGRLAALGHRLPMGRGHHARSSAAR